MTKSSDKPGSILKALRLERRLTLLELSGRTGLPVSTLSKVENGKMTLSYDKLQALGTGLGIDIGVLFKTAAPEPTRRSSSRRSVHKLGEGRVVHTHLTSYLYLASELRNKQFIPLIADVQARSLEAFGEMLTHEGEEFTFVLEGTLEFHSEQYTPVLLRAGESVYFDSGMPHAYVAVSDVPCRILTVCSSTEAQLFDAVDRSRPPHRPPEVHRVAEAKPPRQARSTPASARPEPLAKAARAAPGASKDARKVRRPKPPAAR